jgi:hypothetical protein
LGMRKEVGLCLLTFGAAEAQLARTGQCTFLRPTSLETRIGDLALIGITTDKQSVYPQYASLLQLLPESALERIAKRSTYATMSSVSQKNFELAVGQRLQLHDALCIDHNRSMDMSEAARLETLY